ncbi:GTPase [Nonlabens sp. SY33080]|uniref:GTPase n=1 Tax=Nonlabens sp. SY33080 TaxID=2719911 RepID=UPI001428D5A4|nr:GTPase [Nonlabens sp. SY33080]
MSVSRVIFVYNANSGAINAVLDSAHKILSPKTYNCALCNLTYGIFKEKEEWLRFRESVDKLSNLSFEFLHKDEFEKNYKSKWLPKYSYPIILTTNQRQEIEVLASSLELSECKETKDLISLIESRLKEHNIEL